MADRDGKSDHEWHAHLMCDLSHMLTEEDLKKFKQVLRTAAKVPDKEIDKVNNFFELWNILEQSGYVGVGKYDVLIDDLDMLKINKGIIKIREHTIKIEEYRERKRQRKESVDALSESRIREMVKDEVASAMRQFEERISNIGDRINNVMKTTAEELSAKVTDMVNKELSKRLSAKAQSSTPVVVKAATSAEVNRIVIYGKTLLMCGAEGGDIVNVNSLLQSGADPDLKHETDGKTALMNASQYGYKEIVALLLEKNADVNLQDKNRWTPLMLASQNGHKEIVALLLENNADVNLQNKDGWTALMAASRNGHKEIVALLLEDNVDVNLQDKDGWTALILATKNGHKEIATFLLENNADVNLQNEYGWTALVEAFLKGHTEIVALLLETNADVNLLGKDGQTALMIASRHGPTESVALLLENNADVNLQDKRGRTALSRAKDWGHGDIVKLLKAAGAK